MSKVIATLSLVLALAVAAVASSAAAATTPVSPGACHMLEAAKGQGLAGMDGSQGGKNMVPLVVASLGAGCTP